MVTVGDRSIILKCQSKTTLTNTYRTLGSGLAKIILITTAEIFGKFEKKLQNFNMVKKGILKIFYFKTFAKLLFWEKNNYSA